MLPVRVAIPAILVSVLAAVGPLVNDTHVTPSDGPQFRDWVLAHPQG